VGGASVNITESVQDLFYGFEALKEESPNQFLKTASHTKLETADSD